MTSLVCFYTRVRKLRLRLLGIWMVSRATDEGLKGKVTEKMILASISN